MSSPLVSVIIPTFDRPPQLADALQSVLQQTWPHYEILVVNDGGLDVGDVIDACGGSDRVRYLRHAQQRGPPAARNTAIQQAGGKYIAYLDDDDRYYPIHLETLVTFLETTGSAAAYTDALTVGADARGHGAGVTERRLIHSEDFDADRILVENFIPTLCVMHARACFDRVATFDETLQTHEDWDLWIRLSREFPFAHVKTTTCEFTRRAGGTVTASRRPEFAATRSLIYQRYHPLARNRPAVLAAQEKMLRREQRLLRRARLAQLLRRFPRLHRTYRRLTGK